MSSTEKTSHGLNRWIGTDKPARSDFVTDNVKIDGQVMWKSDYDPDGAVAAAGGITGYAMSKSAYDPDGAVAGTAGGISGYAMSKGIYDPEGIVAGKEGGISAYAMPYDAYDPDRAVQNAGGIKAYVDSKVVVIDIDQIYPVGSIYLTVNPGNPGALIGGNWTAWGAGRVPVGVDVSAAEFGSVEKEGGTKTQPLTVAQLPVHDHTVNRPMNNLAAGGGDIGAEFVMDRATGATTSRRTRQTGNGEAHNNLQPYITCYMWKRVE